MPRCSRAVPARLPGLGQEMETAARLTEPLPRNRIGCLTETLAPLVDVIRRIESWKVTFVAHRWASTVPWFGFKESAHLFLTRTFF